MSLARSAEKGRGARPGIEWPEHREVLSAAVTPLFAVHGQVTSPGQAAAVDFLFTSGSLTKPKRWATVLLGLEPRPASGSLASPAVTKVVGPGGIASPAAGSSGAPFLTRVAVPSDSPSSFTATVADRSAGAGGFALDAYLAGDVNGDLKVDEADLDRIRVAYGSRAGDSRYDTVADVNQDGRVG